MVEPFRLNPQVMRTGLGWAQSWTDGPILCVLSPSSVRFVIVNEHSFIASWEWPEPTQSSARFFLIPPFVANTLSGPAAWDLVRMRVQLERNHVILFLRDSAGEYLLQWQWDPNVFPAPHEFEQMSAVPEEVMQTNYVAIADAVHLAIANLGRLEVLEDVHRDSLAILIDFAPGRLSIDGQQIMQGDAQRYYFDPRLIIRGLEVVRGRNIGFSMSRLEDANRAILYMTSERDKWQVFCSILSIGLDADVISTAAQVRERTDIERPTITRHELVQRKR